MDAKPTSIRGADDLFFVKNKDFVLGVCKWEDQDHAVILEDYSLPTFISEYFDSWLSSRTPPKHRANIHKVLVQVGALSTRGILSISLGLSLIDTFWVTTNPQQNWNSVSLFRNAFNDLIAAVAFAGVSVGDIAKTTSPEFGTDGMLAKCWRRHMLEGTDGIWLYKTGTYPEMEDLAGLKLRGAENLGVLEPWDKMPQVGLEPYAEVAAHQVLNALGWIHVPYTLSEFKGRTVSICPIMTSESQMFMNMSTFRMWKHSDVRPLAEQLNFERELAQMYIFDFLMLNVDRHAGNYGVILNADTLDFQWFAPLFDHGNSLLSIWENQGYSDEEFLARKDALNPDLWRHCKQAKSMGYIFGELSNLIDFHFDYRALGVYPRWALERMEEILRLRLKQFYLM